jgi:putative transposase
MTITTTDPTIAVISDQPGGSEADAGATPVLSEELARGLVAQAKAEGTALTGPGGMLGKLTKMVLETALEAELTAHLGYEAHDPAGRNGGNSRNGSRTRTVLTEIGPVEIDVPRDRDGSFTRRSSPSGSAASTGSRTSWSRWSPGG